MTRMGVAYYPEHWPRSIWEERSAPNWSWNRTASKSRCCPNSNTLAKLQYKSIGP